MATNALITRDLPPAAMVTTRHFRDVIEKQIRAVAKAVGREAGFEYAEGFRRTRYGGIERMVRDKDALPEWV